MEEKKKISKQKSILFTTKAMETIEKFKFQHNEGKEKDKQISFNKAVNKIIELHTSIMNYKQLEAELKNINNNLSEIKSFLSNSKQ